MIFQILSIHDKCISQEIKISYSIKIVENMEVFKLKNSLKLRDLL